MKHKKIKSLLGAYLDGELHGRTKTEIEEHLEVCSECSEELKFLKALHIRIKEEKIKLPVDSYWDYFPRRIMQRIKEKNERSFFSLKAPRIKWELAGGIILILLTFVVSKQIIMEKGIKRVDERGIIRSEKVAPRDMIISKGGEVTEVPLSSTDEVSVRAIEKVEGKKVEIEKNGIYGLKEKKAIMKKAEPVSIVSKSTVIEKPSAEKTAGAVGGISEEQEAKIGQAVFSRESGQITDNEKEVLEIQADIKAKEDYLRVCRDENKSRDARRGLLRLLYVEAERTRKREVIERAQKEIEFYQDSYPDEFQDTLIIFSDSLRIMMEELKESESTEESE